MARPRLPRSSFMLAGVLLALACDVRLGAPSETAARDLATCVAPSKPGSDRALVRALAGVWWRYEPGVEGDLVRFYYFHGDGKGLYRYGRIGHTMTNSFDYDVRGGMLHLRFRKPGTKHEVTFRIEPGIEDGSEGGSEATDGPPARDWLVLENDPREPGTTRYFRDAALSGSGPVALENLGPAPAGHMWIDHTPYATGGDGFLFYQFRPAGIDGRGVGWFHKGDFDDWSTESLTYRITADRIELDFPLAREHASTTFRVVGKGKQRRLELDLDPRDHWHPHVYRDAGRSFGNLGAFTHVAGTANWPAHP